MKKNNAIANKIISPWLKCHKRGISICGHALLGGLLGMGISSSALALGPSFNSHTGLDGNPTSTTDSTLIMQMNNPVANIRWNHFNTDQNHVVTFRQGGSNFTAINRIAGAQTKFHGTLNANGRIVLINQNGFLFGPTSQINVGSFMATTNGKGLPANPSDFESWLSSHKKAPNYAEIINKGSITITKDGGFAYLVAPYVRNNGTIKSRKGVSDVTIGLGAIDVTKKGKKAADGSERKGVVNTGTLRASAGYIAMVNRIFDAAVNVGGIVDVDAFAKKDDGGTILVASNGNIKLKGAKFTARGGRDVEVRLRAKKNIVSVGDEVTTFKLKAESLGDKRVKANLDMEAGRKIDIKIDASVVAEAANAEAEFDVEGKRGVSITTGDDTILVKAIADGKMGKSGDAYADADLDIDSKGNITVNGHVVVKAKADAPGKMSAARAYADIEIGDEWDADLVTINGDIDVTARANTGYYFSTLSRAVASSVIIADGKDGEINFTGNMNVVAKSGDGDQSSATAEGYLISSGDINVSGDQNIKAMSWGEGSRSMVWAGILSGGDVNYNGDQNIKARSWGYDSTSMILAELYSEGDFNYNGDQNFNAKSWGYNSMSLVGVLLTSEGDVNYNGDMNFNARSWGINSMSLAGALLLSSGDLVYNGDANVSAKAKSRSRGRRSSSNAIAVSGLAMLAGINLGNGNPTSWINPSALTVNGDVLVEAKANSRGPLSRSFALGLGILASGGDVNINTDPVIVNSTAISKGRRSRATSIAGLFTIAGLDVVVSSIASYLGWGNVPISAQPANLNIVGDLEANAIAQAPRDRSERAIAANVLFAPGDITIRGADPLASANEALAQGQTTMFEVCGDDGIGCFDGPGVELHALFETWIPRGRANSYAQLIVEAGGTVDIQPKQDESISGPNELFAFRPNSRPSGAPGNQPLRITNNGDMLAATGFGVTQPPPIQVAEVNNIDVEAAILAGADPATLLPPTAAGGDAQNINDNDTMTSSATPDFCDRLVSGACYETE